MSISKSPDPPDSGQRVLEFLRDYFNKDRAALVSASQVSAALDIAGREAREHLSDWALRGALKPLVAMTCAECGTINEDAEENEREAFCRVCGERTSHSPALLFALADLELLDGHSSSPKKEGRQPLPRGFRPGPINGARSPVLKRTA